VDIIIVTAFDRISSVNACLEHLSRCDSIDDFEVWLSEDTHQGAHEYTIPAFKNFRHIKPDVKNSRENWIAAMKLAYETDAGYVHIIEDDINVGENYLSWTRLAHETFQPFVTFGTNVLTEYGTDPSAVAVSHSDFASWAMCIRRQDLIVSIERPDMHPEESIHNSLIEDKRLAVWPLMPRAFNTGLPSPRFHTGTFGGPATSLHVACDRRSLWQQAYKAQARWGTFTTRIRISRAKR